jgi:hypothetical protein
MHHAAYFHDDSASVRFWVEVDGQSIGASISRQTLHYRFQPQRSDDEPLATYQAHIAEIEAAVRSRVAAGSLEPVMLREHDLRPRG